MNKKDTLFYTLSIIIGLIMLIVFFTIHVNVLFMLGLAFCITGVFLCLGTIPDKYWNYFIKKITFSKLNNAVIVVVSKEQGGPILYDPEECISYAENPSEALKKFKETIDNQPNSLDKEIIKNLYNKIKNIKKMELLYWDTIGAIIFKSDNKIMSSDPEFVIKYLKIHSNIKYEKQVIFREECKEFLNLINKHGIHPIKVTKYLYNSF